MLVDYVDVEFAELVQLVKPITGIIFGEAQTCELRCDHHVTSGFVLLEICNALGTLLDHRSHSVKLFSNHRV
ncbi:hypothetical protein Tsubulata_003012 [Turnera subulata]|uniref:Uncharacterized protein n=1 Tax=Turnera subulata TaxID=218843 RepID=A0A9Q0JHW7_9ROSI|nr:hypothetical protein Tsubulata_003012 [Turnera subulata]